MTPAPAVIGAVTALLEYARWLSQSKEIHHSGVTDYRIREATGKSYRLNYRLLYSNRKTSPFHRSGVTVSP